MYKTILCAIEVCEEGKTVLAKAHEIASKLEAKLVVVSVLPYSLLPKNYQKELKEKTKPKFEKIVNKFDIPNKNQVLKVGKPYEAICSTAEKKQADLIILGTHSKKGIQALLGSTASGVANTASCDVTLIKV